MGKVKLIQWESWNEKYQDYINSFKDEENIDGEYDDGYKEDYSGMEAFYRSLEPENIITPHGVLHTANIWKPTDRWDMRIAYTNFNISHTIRDLLNEVEGVEGLRVLGRYSFLICIGKLFNFADVRKSIQELLCNSPIEEKYKQSVEEIKKQLSEYPYWMIYVSPKGEIKYTHSHSIEDYSDKRIELEELKNKTGGTLLRSVNG